DRTPGGWVNTQGKFAVRKVGDKQVLVKLAANPSPLVARANAFMTKPNLGDYTIQADMQGVAAGKDLPDMGVANCRYHLIFDGNKQQLRLYSWDALPRVDNTINMEWKPGVWYTFKLAVEPEGDKAKVRGKVWEAGKPEPEKWTLEVE